jgi:hypothetical protein
LLAVSAYFGGALTALHPDYTPWAIAVGPNGAVVVGGWLVGTALLVVAWWQGRALRLTVRWTYVTCLLWALPLLVTAPLGSRDVYSYACQGAVYAAGADPYRVGVADLPCPWVDSVSMIWRHTPAPYGPLFVVLAGAAVRVGGGLAGTIAGYRLVALFGVALVAWWLPVLAKRCGVDRERALWLALACPLVVVHLIGGAHNDALMLGLLVAGLAVAASRPARPATLLAGGAVLGLATGVKASAAVVLPFVALVGARERRLSGAAWVFGGAAAAAVAASLAAGLGVGWLRGLAHSGDSVQWTAPPTAVGMTVDYAIRLFGGPPLGMPITVVRAVALGVLAVLLVALWWRTWQAARRTDSPAAALYGAGLALAATVALGPVFHPWYLTWPLVVLAATTERTRLLAVLAAGASFLVLPDGSGLARVTKVPGALAMTAVVGYVATRAARAVAAGYRARRPPHRPGSSASAASDRSATGRTGRDSAG